MEAPQKEPQDDEIEVQQEEPGTSSISSEPSIVEQRKRRSKLKPTLPLPSGRLNVDKELAMLKAYVSQSKSGEKAVHFNDIASLIQTHETSVSASKEFWQEIGLLQRESRGVHKPSSGLVAWASKIDFDTTEANESLHAAYDRAWFGDRVRSAFQVHGSIKKGQLENILASTAGGEKDETGPRSRVLVELLVETGYLREADNGDLTFAANSPRPSASDSDQPASLQLSETARQDRFEVPAEIKTPPRSTTAGIAVNLEISISNWNVDDVIRLVKFLRTGQDGDASEPEIQAAQP
ncbi:MAG TPA: hypothetical protein VEO18_04185 [Thermoplasmata archaeon]|nr:hypothetical protein [Thermoplasmata archaeon]